jgi:DNA ligase D-like protein (predicted 3'-phosphoesterase)
MSSKLGAYKKKRDFRKTAEPDGGKAGKGRTPVFVIQKHDARNLHYDFRLEVGGVLVSWAVPKGPSTDPRVKRMAVQTEDHPLEYADFEGVIPEGEYGAGTVMVWDKGTYENRRARKEGDGADMARSIEDGKVEVVLDGRKISGGYHLIRTGTEKGERSRWLLMKARDEKADARRNPLSTETKSVRSGRTLEEIARQSRE